MYINGAPVSYGYMFSGFATETGLIHVSAVVHFNFVYKYLIVCSAQILLHYICCSYFMF